MHILCSSFQSSLKLLILYVQVDEQNEFSLRLIGYVGITISLVCLLLTVLIFCCLKLVITFVTVHHNNTCMYDNKRVMKHRLKENERMRKNNFHIRLNSGFMT